MSAGIIGGTVAHKDSDRDIRKIIERLRKQKRGEV
jgi:hypothetical protein